MPRIVTPPPILPIRLVALDIDGTLVGDDLTIGPDTLAAVRAARDRGVVVTLVTGRMVSSAMRFARELGIDAPLVGYQGALIRAMPEVGSPRLGRLLLHTPLSAPVAREIVHWTRSVGLDPHLNHLERFILRADDPHADDYSAFMGARAELATDLVAAIRHPITKVLAVADPPLPTELAPLARERFAGVADVTISHPRFLEFVAPGVSKGRAIRWMARHLGIALGATLAIGDQWNDIEMLAEVGHGTAMPTAPTAVRAVARYVAPSLANEGVARMIEALVLAGPAGARAASERLAAEASERRVAERVEATVATEATVRTATAEATVGTAGTATAEATVATATAEATVGTAGTATAEAAEAAGAAERRAVEASAMADRWHTDHAADRLAAEAPDRHAKPDRHAAEATDRHANPDRHAAKAPDRHADPDRHAAEATDRHANPDRHAAEAPDGHADPDRHAAEAPDGHADPDRHAAEAPDGHADPDRHAAEAPDGHADPDRHAAEALDGHAAGAPEPLAEAPDRRSIPA